MCADRRCMVAKHVLAPCTCLLCWDLRPGVIGLTLLGLEATSPSQYIRSFICLVSHSCSTNKGQRWTLTLGTEGKSCYCSGHSLGAGVAALMTLRLKDRFPSAKCWAFCPPGGLMSANLSHAAQGFVNCVVVGKDIVPRLSVVNIGRLIDELV